MRTLLITGSSGLVGRAVVDHYKDKEGWIVIGVDNNQRASMFGTASQAVHHQLDIRNNREVDILFDHYRFDAIIHAAAQPSHDYSKDHLREDFEINTIGTINLLEAAKMYVPQTSFVYVSTDKVYGTNMWPLHPVKELTTRYDSMRPFDENISIDKSLKSPFGCSKLAADLYVQEFGLYYGMNTVCFRPGCITGKNHEGAELHGFLAYLAKCIRTGKPYKIYGYKGKQVRDQIHANDLVSAFAAFIDDPKVARVYNIGGGPERSISILEAIQMIEKRTKKRAIIEYVDTPRWGDRIWDVHDVSLFRRDYPEWDYKYSLSDIIKDVCEKEL